MLPSKSSQNERTLSYIATSFSVTVSPSLDVRGLGGEPDEVGADEDHAGAHDGEERPEAGVRLQRLPSHALQE